MSFIPFDALEFGGRSHTETSVSYDKSRISGSTTTSYILHEKGGCMPGQKDLFTKTSRNPPGMGAPVTENPITNAFKRERYIESRPVIGIKYPKTELDNYTYDQYVANDDDSLNLAIRASYRQVFGNFGLMESERTIEPERRLRNGDITIREFIRCLAKSEFYRTHYYEHVNQQRFIELTFKHLLGRPPKSQIEVIKHIEMTHNQGFEFHIDSLIDSLEYQEVFGEFTVPFQRCWDSSSGSKTVSFVNTACLTRSFATSDNAIHGRRTLPEEPGGSAQLVDNLTKENPHEIIIPDHAKYLSQQKKEWLIRLEKEELGSDNDQM